MNLFKFILNSKSKIFVIESILLPNAELEQIRTIAVVRICYSINGEKKYLIKKH